jgi:hypothetical protein
MARPLIQRNEKLVYSTRWFDSEADQSDCPPHIAKVAFEIVIVDERHEAMAKRPTLFNFLKSEVRSHAFA